MSSKTEAAGTAGIAARALRGTLALSAVVVVNILGQLLLVPLAIRYWGAATYGEWVSLSALVAALALADLGVQTHAANAMCAACARDDPKSALDTLHSALRAQVPIVGLLWMMCCVLAAALPLGRLLSLEQGTANDVWLIVVGLSAELAIAVPAGLTAGVYRATGRMARAATLSLVQRGVQFAIPLIAIPVGADAPTVAILRPLWAAAFTVFVLVDLTRVYPWFHLRPLGGSFRAGARMFGPGSLFVLIGIADFMSLQVSLMLLQRHFGGTEVATYATHRTVVNVARMAAVQSATALWPEFTALDAVGDSKRLQRAHRSLAKLNGLMVSAILFGLVPVVDVLYVMWTARAIALDQVTLGFLAAQTVLWGFWSAGATVLGATNRQAHLVKLMLANALIGVVAAVFAVPAFGTRGAAAVAFGADLLLASWAIPWAACAAIGDGFRGYLRAVLPVFAGGALMPVLVGAALWVTLPPGWARRAAVVSACATVAVPLVWLVLAPDERDVVRRLRARLPLWGGA